MAKVKSARGETVDFDLLKIKGQLASVPKPVDIVHRESYIDRKLRRRQKLRKQAIENQTLDETFADTKKSNQ
jgi:hypothetical protein